MKKYLTDKEELNYFNSKEFKDNMIKIIEEDTWDKGLPKIYLNDKDEIIEHYKNGTIKILKDGKD